MLRRWLEREIAEAGVLVVEPVAEAVAEFSGRPGVTALDGVAAVGAEVRPAAARSGSITRIWPDAMPRSIQPRNRAPPILPQPTSSSEPAMAQASPAVSSSAASMASDALLPPQTTNWKAG